MIRRITDALSDDTRKWAVATAAIGIVTGVVMLLLEMEPRLVLVGLVVVLATAAVWLIGDLAVGSAPVSWHNYQSLDSGAARPDRRVQMLRARLRQPTRRRRTVGPGRAVGVERADPSDEIAESLVAVIDDHLLAEHGVDRVSDAGAAAAVLGSALDQFVNDVDARRSMTQRRTLARTIVLIEDFTSIAAPPPTSSPSPPPSSPSPPPSPSPSPSPLSPAPTPSSSPSPS